MRSLLTLFLFSTTAAYAQQATVNFYAPELFPPSVSGAVCGFSPGGNTIYFVREDTLADKFFIYYANKKGDKWADEKLISFSGQYNDMGGRLSPDGKTFYFTSDRPDGANDKNDQWNIWASQFANGNWSEATPLTAINDKGSECCAMPVDDKIIFSSDRGQQQQWWIYSWNGNNDTAIAALTEATAWQWPLFYVASQKLMLLNSMKRKDTKGMDDVYVSFYRNNNWTSPVNIGQPVNTAVYEDGAILSPDEKYLLFNRHETGSTPSRVMYAEWKPILKEVKQKKSSITFNALITASFCKLVRLN